MTSTEIIRILLERAMECQKPIGSTVSFTISGIQRQDSVESQAAHFFRETFGVEMKRSGKRNERHFAFTLKEAMKQPIPAINPPSRRAHRFGRAVKAVRPAFA